ncbi:hydantoinase/carbamoylase family amidase [Sodalis ligni]|uniref:hydantoinase/carbamoylase family amidase n=1 Tax=Sodalis ligni TaxID=2697027 RepID=UPI00193F36DD|nr:hydantoinase/carbamoylase family amidase [Sodalis ligni]QWA10967.1 hydantoinase/carbamoylase family amidase [Sodalis ligni]
MKSLQERVDAITQTIKSGRLWDSIMEMAKYGATANGGVNRLALTETDNAVRIILMEWINRPNYHFFVDAIGNLFIRRDGATPSLDPVMTGSHLDTQPSGGKFDGIYGVLAGLEVFRTLDDLDMATVRPLELAVWANEEGCRFVPGCMGSACFAKPDDLPHWLAITDDESITVAQAVARYHKTLSGIPHRPLGTPVHAYVEAHIEQGPVLENTSATIGIVSGIQGCRDFQVTISGMEAHAGTTPASSRQDAMKTAVLLLRDLYTVMDSAGDECRFTVGAFQVYPNSSSVVPGQVVFNIDLRHPLQSSLTALGNKVIELCDKHTGRCSIRAKELRWRKPVEFSKVLPDLIQNAAHRLKLPNRVLPSGASHDAVNLHLCCPTGMIFVPCERGISHNEKENAALADLHAGTQVLAEVLYRLAENIP